jgi:hypothetical protein
VKKSGEKEHSRCLRKSKSEGGERKQQHDRIVWFIIVLLYLLGWGYRRGKQGFSKPDVFGVPNLLCSCSLFFFCIERKRGRVHHRSARISHSIPCKPLTQGIPCGTVLVLVIRSAAFRTEYDDVDVSYDSVHRKRLAPDVLNGKSGITK